MSLHLKPTMSKSAQRGRLVLPRFTGVTGRLRCCGSGGERVAQRRDKRATRRAFDSRQQDF